MPNRSLATVAVAAAFINLCGSSATIAFSQTPSDATPPPCIQNTTPGPDGAPVPNFPKTLIEYVAKKNLIAIGQVQSVDTVPLGNRQISVALFALTEVLKSSGPSQTIAAGAPNFGGTFLMKPGQRYILFLDEANAAFARSFPERPGVPSFRIDASLCIDAVRNVHSFTRDKRGLDATLLSPILGPLDGLALDKSIETIRAAIASSTGAKP